jgi:hypothetical protein
LVEDEDVLTCTSGSLSFSDCEICQCSRANPGLVVVHETSKRFAYDDSVFPVSAVASKDFSDTTWRRFRWNMARILILHVWTPLQGDNLGFRCMFCGGEQLRHSTKINQFNRNGTFAQQNARNLPRDLWSYVTNQPTHHEKEMQAGQEKSQMAD